MPCRGQCSPSDKIDDKVIVFILIQDEAARGNQAEPAITPKGGEQAPALTVTPRMHYTNMTLKEESEMPVTRSTEGNESTSKKSTRTAKAAAVPEATASESATVKKAAAKTAPAASKPKKTAAVAEAKPAPEATPEATSEATSEVGTASGPPSADITLEQKLQMIAEAAYFRAERRGFVGGNPTEDWAAAEAEVEARLSQPSAQKK
jgi:hypothetical protein